ncbi:hypothetical protein N9C01_02690 [bacterium]|nr:hypothetical protein [bacterium]MDB4499295.1 hypothetical protein [Akkermansiaceae bacterium]
MSRNFLFILVPLLFAVLPSCSSSNPLSSNFLDSKGTAERKWRNDNPVVQNPSWGSHASTVSRLTAQGFTVIGYGQVKGREIIDAENARLLAVEKNADVVVFSTQDLGVFTESVAIPVQGRSTNSSNYQRYGSSSSSGSSSSTTTDFSYEKQNFRLFDHKTTLLRSRSKGVPVPPLSESDRVRSLPKTAPRPKLKSAPKPVVPKPVVPKSETYYLGWNSLLKPTNPS